MVMRDQESTDKPATTIMSSARTLNPAAWTSTPKGQRCRPIKLPPSPVGHATDLHSPSANEGRDSSLLGPAALAQLQAQGLPPRSVEYVWRLSPKKNEEIYGNIEPEWCCAMSTICLPVSLLCGCCMYYNRQQVKKWMNEGPFAAVTISEGRGAVLWRGASQPLDGQLQRDLPWLRAYYSTSVLGGGAVSSRTPAVGRQQ